MTPLEVQFLQASAELVRRQQEIAPLLAEYLGVSPAGLYRLWMEERERVRQTGRIEGSEWYYFFHGLECDLNHRDGRAIRLDFGPQGRLDTFTPQGVMQFVMAVREPWRQFPELRAYLTQEASPNPYGSPTGSHQRMSELADALNAAGMVEPADIWLAQLRETYTVRGTGDTAFRIELPLVLNPEAYEDALVCARWVLSAKGWQQVGADERIEGKE